MFLKQIDILSPEITLFYRGHLSHTSIISGILTIIAVILVILCSIGYFLGLLYPEFEEPKVSSYTSFVEDAGIFPVNSSSFFHFISIIKDSHCQSNEEFDFTSFSLIGLETFIQDYEDDNNITKYNHWLYGFCNNESVTIGISHLLIQNYFTKSACIKKYYDNVTKEYYTSEHPKFKWPNMAHGTFNINKKFYSLILKKCDKKILNEVFGNSYECKTDEEINKYFKFGLIHFNFIDQYADILKYKQPNRKCFYRIENSLDKENYSINHINFNPSIIRTKKGLVRYHAEEILIYEYERNDVFTHQSKGEIYMGYSLWMNNRMKYYERTYKRIQELLSQVGGVAESIIFIATLVNKLINKYIIITDTQELLCNYKLPIKEIKIQKTLKNASLDNIEFNPKKRNNDNSAHEKNTFCSHSNDRIFEKNNISNKNENKENPIYLDEKSFKFGNSNIITNSNNEKSDNNINNKPINNKNEKIRFFNYFIYKLSFGKKYNNLKVYEDFREKIISVENLIKNHLHINKLLNVYDKNNIHN